MDESALVKEIAELLHQTQCRDHLASTGCHLGHLIEARRLLEGIRAAERQVRVGS